MVLISLLFVITLTSIKLAMVHQSPKRHKRLKDFNHKKHIFELKKFDQLVWSDKFRVVIIGTIVVWREAIIGMFVFQMAVIFTLFVGNVLACIVSISVLLIYVGAALKYEKEIKAGHKLLTALRNDKSRKAKKQGKAAPRVVGILNRLECFWSRYNRTATVLTTRLLYRMLGGRSRPLAATLITFLYSFLLLHPILPLVLIGYLYASLGVSMMLIMGFIVGTNKQNKLAHS